MDDRKGQLGGLSSIPPSFDHTSHSQEPQNEEAIADMITNGKALDEAPVWFIEKYDPEIWRIFQILYRTAWNT